MSCRKQADLRQSLLTSELQDVIHLNLTCRHSWLPNRFEHPFQVLQELPLNSNILPPALSSFLQPAIFSTVTWRYHELPWHGNTLYVACIHSNGCLLLAARCVYEYPNAVGLKLPYMHWCTLNLGTGKLVPEYNKYFWPFSEAHGE